MPLPDSSAGVPINLIVTSGACGSYSAHRPVIRSPARSDGDFGSAWYSPADSARHRPPNAACPTGFRILNRPVVAEFDTGAARSVSHNHAVELGDKSAPLTCTQPSSFRVPRGRSLRRKCRRGRHTATGTQFDVLALRGRARKQTVAATPCARARQGRQSTPWCRWRYGRPDFRPPRSDSPPRSTRSPYQGAQNVSDGT